jgi:hypothetical protein
MRFEVLVMPSLPAERVSILKCDHAIFVPAHDPEK